MKNLKLKLILTYSFILLFYFNISAKEDLCNILILKGEYHDAIKEADITLKLTKKNYKVLLCRGQANLKINDYKNAINDFELASKSSLNDLDFYMAKLFKSVALKNAKQYEEAIKLIYETISSNNINSSIKRLFLIQSGEVNLQLNKYDEALNDLMSALKLAANDSERAKNLDNLSHAYVLSKKMNAAIEFKLKANLTYEKVGLLDEYTETGISLASLYSQIGDFENAERTFLKFEVFARDNGGLYYLANILFLQSKFYAEKSNITLSKSKFDEANKIANDIGAKDLIELYH
jgi:tetratricopeptide (TPR) repeat protein